MNLAGAFRRVATTSQALFGTSGNILLTPVGGSAKTLDAVVYREKIEWRTEDGDRYRVITRVVQLPPDSSDVPIGSVFEVDGRSYTVETADRSSASESQMLSGIQYAAAITSRPGSYQ